MLTLVSGVGWGILVGPTVTGPVSDPLAVLNLEKQLYLLLKMACLYFVPSGIRSTGLRRQELLPDALTTQATTAGLFYKGCNIAGWKSIKKQPKSKNLNKFFWKLNILNMKKTAAKWQTKVQMMVKH